MTLKLSAQSTFWVFEVADDGIGIPKSRLEDIFEMLSQIASTRQHAQGGLGIGLAAARSVARAHGGRIGRLVQALSNLLVNSSKPS